MRPLLHPVRMTTPQTVLVRNAGARCAAPVVVGRGGDRSLRVSFGASVAAGLDVLTRAVDPDVRHRWLAVRLRRDHRGRWVGCRPAAIATAALLGLQRLYAIQNALFLGSAGLDGWLRPNSPSTNPPPWELPSPSPPRSSGFWHTGDCRLFWNLATLAGSLLAAPRRSRRWGLDAAAVAAAFCACCGP